MSPAAAPPCALEEVLHRVAPSLSRPLVDTQRW
jgi:hypothetical protein